MLGCMRKILILPEFVPDVQMIIFPTEETEKQAVFVL
jgi:hypothetical protein